MKKNKQLVPKRRFKEFEKSGEWREVELGSVANIVGGGTPSTVNLEYWNGNIEWYSPVEIGNKIFIESSQNKITELGLKKSSAKILPIGTVLFTSRAGIGNTAILDKEGATNQGFQSIIPITNRLDSYFIYSRTRELKEYGEKFGAGSTFIEVSGKQMEKMEIRIPNINEQTMIGNFFRNLDNLKINQEVKIKKIKKIKESYLSDMFPKEGEKYPRKRFDGFSESWEEKRLGELGFYISDGNYGELYPKASEFIKCGVPFIRVNNLKNGYLIKEGLIFISPALHSTLRSGHLKTDDVLITTRGQIGKIAYVDESFAGANINAQICLIRTEEQMSSMFLHQFLQTFQSQREILSFQSGSALKQLPKKRLDDIIIKYPESKAEQIKIGEFFMNLDAQIGLEEQKLNKLEQLKQAYLNELFV